MGRPWEHRTVPPDLDALRPTWRPPNGYGGTVKADAYAEDPFGPIDEPTAGEPKRRHGHPRKNKYR
jgi:hypothetical protein